ncbi:MAG: nucleotide sugar dehydrogenase [Caldilineaceae bacterium]
MDIAIICVGTPSRSNGDADTSYVEKVCHDIGTVLRNRDSYLVVVLRSTMLPGQAQHNLIPILEAASGKQVGRDFGFCVNPEFLREGSAVADFDNPPYTIIGEFDAQSGDALEQLYAHLNAPLYRVNLGVSEMVKYASNVFHAIKVVFANEIGNLCKDYGVDSHAVMDVFTQDNKLNLSPYYLKPGFAFGGSCLGKDTRALLYAARQKDLRLPMLESILPSNQLQVEKALDMITATGKRKIGIIGLSFKANTDDLRESPAVELAERLLGKGYEVHIYDREVSLSRLHGSNKSFITQSIPHIAALLRPTLQETLERSESVVVTKRLSTTEYQSLATELRHDQILFDLVRLNGSRLSALQESTMAFVGKVLIVVQNLPVPLDRRVWLESMALREMWLSGLRHRTDRQKGQI